MVDIRLIQQILGMGKEEKEKLLKNSKVYQHYSQLFKKGKGKAKRRELVNLAIEAKIESTSIEENLLAYLKLKEDAGSIFELADTCLGKFSKQKYSEAIQTALQEKDPAECTKMLAEIYAAIRQEVMFVVGEELTGQSAEGEPFETKASTYIKAAMQYLEGLKKK